MNTNEIGYVVDKLTAVLGAGVAKAQPVAEEVLRQYVQGQWLFCALAGSIAVLVAILLVCVLIACYKKVANARQYTDTDGYVMLAILAVVILGGAAAVLISLTVDAAVRAVAPLPSMLHMM
jgi:heme/copper-type cytochrome/quinol oxidase subunit 2